MTDNYEKQQLIGGPAAFDKEREVLKNVLGKIGGHKFSKITL